jgi:TP901 family phage tail tape measure protein
MSSAGGGGVNLPPIVQPIQVSVSGNGAAAAQFGRIMGSASGASGALTGVGNATRTMNQQVMRTLPTWRTAGDAMRQAGSLMQYTIAAPLLQIGKASLEAAKQFEKSMAMITGLVGIPAAEVAKMGEEILAMAGDVGKAPLELADALYFITSAGVKGAQAMETLDASARAAAAGLGTTQAVADVVTSVMNAYPEGLYSATLATDILTAAVREGKAEASSFAPAMGKVLPVAAAFGLKFQDVAAAMAALTRFGKPAGTAAIELRQIMASLLKPTQQAKETLESYGLSSQTLRDTIVNQGMFAGLEQLKGALGENANAYAAVFGNVRPLTAITALLGPSMQRNAVIFDELSSAAGDSALAFEAVQQTASQKWAETSAVLQASLIDIGNGLAPMSKALADLGKVLATALGGLARIPGITKFIAGFAGMAVGVAVMTRTLATFIRMRALTTIALQGLTGGLRDSASQMVTNIVTGKSYSYAQQQQATATAQTGAAQAGAVAPARGLSATMQQLSLVLNQLMVVMTENSVIVAESSAFNRALAVSQGNVVTSTQAMTNAVLAGDTALSRHAAAAAAAASGSGTVASGMSAATGATATATGATSAHTAATSASTAATTAATGATAASTGATISNAQAQQLALAAQLKMSTGLMQKLFLIGLDAKGMALTSVVTGKFATMQIYAAGATALLGGALKSLLVTMGPMLLITVGLGLLMSKFLGGGADETKEKVGGAADAIRNLEDQTSTFNPAPLIVGVDVQYNYQTGGSSGNPEMTFAKFLFPEGTANLDEEKQRILDEINGARNNIKDAASKVNFAASFATQFSDPRTQGAAAEYIAGVLNIDVDEVNKKVARAVGDVSTYVNLQLRRLGGGQMKGGVTEVMDNFFDLDGNFDTDIFNSMIEMELPDFTQPFEDAISSGSVPQFYEVLRQVAKGTRLAGGSTKEVEQATVAYAKAAFKAAGGTTRATTVMGLLTENSSLAGSGLLGLRTALIEEHGEAVNTTLSTRELIREIAQLETTTVDATGAVDNFADDVLSLQNAFKDGLNPEIQKISNLMNAYDEALKGVKSGQDALYGSQFDAVKAGVKANAAIRSAMDAIGESGGKWQGTTKAADDLKNELVNVAESILDVGNAAYANGEGGADVAAVRAAQASTEMYQRAVRNMLKAGMKQADIDEFFNSVLGKNIDITQGKVTFDPKIFTQAYSTDLNSAITNVENGLTDTTQEVGENMLTGIVEGIDSNSGLVGEAARNAMKAMITSLKTYLQIQSPSKLLANVIGAPMAMGIAKGLQDKTPAAIKAIEEHMKAVEKAGRQAAGTRSSTTTGTTSTTIAPQVPVVVPEDGTVRRQGMGVGQTYSQGVAQGIVSSQSVVAQAFTGTIYDVTTKYMGHTAAWAKKGGQAWAEKYAEGILNGKSDVSTSVVDLIQAIMQEVSDNLSTTTATIGAILDLSGAKNDLDKFKNSNSQAMLTAGVNQANRQSANATAKFGGNQGTEITRYERAQIADSRKSAQQAQRDYALGKISYTELLDAQQGYADTTAAAGEASKEVVDAQNAVLDANYQNTNSAILLAQEQMKVVTAQQALNTAYVNARINGADATTALTNLGTQAGITTTAINNIVTGLANIPGANMGIGKGVDALIKPATVQNKASKVTRVKGKKKSTSGGGGGGKGGYTGGLAKGGPLSPGKLTLVGESGPEVIKSNSAGNVTPYSVLERYARTEAQNSQRGEYGDSGKSINITVNNPSPEPASDSIARRMQNMSALGLFA